MTSGHEGVVGICCHSNPFAERGKDERLDAKIGSAVAGVDACTAGAGTPGNQSARSDGGVICSVCTKCMGLFSHYIIDDLPSTYRPANATTNSRLTSSRAMKPSAPVVLFANCTNKVEKNISRRIHGLASDDTHSRYKRLAIRVWAGLYTRIRRRRIFVVIKKGIVSHCVNNQELLSRQYRFERFQRALFDSRDDSECEGKGSEDKHTEI